MDITFFLLMCFMCVLSTNPDYKKAKTCYVSVGYNIDYQGEENRTGGAGCVNWMDTTWGIRDFDGTMKNNFCRNPDKDTNGPWCIVRTGHRHHCSIPKCASSAMFDGRGNIEHKLYSLNKTTAENITFAFYTTQKGQNDATLITVKTWTGGQIDIKIQSVKEVNDVIKLQWTFKRNNPEVVITSRPDMAATGNITRVQVIRVDRNLMMRVNDEEFTTVILDSMSTDRVFGRPENIYIGKSPYGTNGFQGCISDVSYNDVRPLDVAMGSRPKPDEETIAISRGVWEGCLLIPPSDWDPPAPLPTETPYDVESNGPIVEVNARLNVNNTLESRGTHSAISVLLVITLFLFLQFG